MTAFLTVDMVGALLVFVAWTSVVAGKWSPTSYQNLLTNLAGCVILGYVGVVNDLPGMVALNVLWGGVALVAVFKRLIGDGVFETREIM